MLDAYRQRFSEYYAQSQREHYLFATGRKAVDESQHWLAEFSDLFTIEAVTGLRTTYEVTNANRPNARAAIARLWQIAEIGRSQYVIRELSAALKQYEREASFTYREQTLNAAQAEKKVWHLAGARERREWSLRSADLLRGGDDLRLERVYKLNDYAAKAGYAHYAALLSERRGVPYGELEAQLTLLLMLTEREYRNALAAWLPSAADVSSEAADECDVEYALRHQRQDVYFDLSRGREVLETLFDGLGFALAKQRNLTIEKPTTLRTSEDAACFVLHAPEDVKLCVAANARPSGFGLGEFLRATGTAQQAAWTSREQLYELRVAGDLALPLAWGYLLAGLLQDSAFLFSHFGFADNAAFLRHRAISELLALRRDAALWLYEVELYSGKFSELRANGAHEAYVERMREVLFYQVSDAQHLQAVAEPLHSGDRLRARAFAAQIREHLKTQFGSRWWATRKAGELLIDVWNTGQRHTVEELAELLGLGKLSYDWLASAALADLANS